MITRSSASSWGRACPLDEMRIGDGRQSRPLRFSVRSTMSMGHLPWLMSFIICRIAGYQRYNFGNGW